MISRRALKMAVDAAMYGLMLALMSYPLTRGLMRHGLCGAAFLALLIVHQLLNLNWYRSLFRGGWNARRILLALADMFLLLSGAALVVSALAMAGEVFSFAPFPMPWWGRDLHNSAAAWTFALASFHLGLHGQSFWSRLYQRSGRAWPVCALAAVLAGSVLFVQSGLWNDMLMTGAPKNSLVSLPFFLVHYLGITLGFCLLARGAWRIAALSKKGKTCSNAFMVSTRVQPASSPRTEKKSALKAGSLLEETL